jgi:hypothetical protein
MSCTTTPQCVSSVDCSRGLFLLTSKEGKSRIVAVVLHRADIDSHQQAARPRQNRGQPQEEVRTMVRVLRPAQIETDGVARLHAELLDWRSGLKPALNFSVGSYYFDRQLSVNRLSNFRRIS